MPAMTTPRRLLPVARLWCCAAALALLGACSALPSKPERPQAFDLGRPLPAAEAAPAKAPLLAIDSVQSSPDLDGTAFLYRLLYAAGGAQNPLPYAQARWTMPPPELLTQRLRQSFAAVRPITEASSGLAPQLLQVQLEEFAHVFHGPAQSEGVVQLRASLLAAQGKGPRLQAQRSFSVRQPAPTHDAHGGAQALQQATDQLLQQLRDWVQSQQPQ